MSTITGHCFCSSIRYEVDGPESFACFCHCESCQRAAGAPLVPWATYKKSSFQVLTGEIRWHHSSPGVTRGHCADCGSAISYENEKRPGEIDITLNTLDDPSASELRAHIWCEDRQPWLMIDDGLPIFPRNIGEAS